jgi:hypothetical protein
MTIRELFNAILDINLLWPVGIFVGILVMFVVGGLLSDMYEKFYESLPQGGKDFMKVMNSFGILSWWIWLMIFIFFISGIFLILK